MVWQEEEEKEWNRLECRVLVFFSSKKSSLMAEIEFLMVRAHAQPREWFDALISYIVGLIGKRDDGINTPDE